FLSSRRRHTSSYGDWSSDVCSSDLGSSRERGGPGAGGPEDPEPYRSREQHGEIPGVPEIERLMSMAGLRVVIHMHGVPNSRTCEIGRASWRERVWVSVVGG